MRVCEFASGNSYTRLCTHIYAHISTQFETNDNFFPKIRIIKDMTFVNQQSTKLLRPVISHYRIATWGYKINDTLPLHQKVDKKFCRQEGKSNSRKQAPGSS